MKFKGTQGEWVVSSSTIDSIGRSCHRVNTNGKPTNEEVEANAKLIGAAPDLLEALQKILPRMGHYDDLHFTDQKIYLNAEKAILKAIG